MSLYWKCQLGGWTAMALWSAAVSLILGTFQWMGVLVSVLISALGLVLTHLYRPVIHRGGWKDLPPSRLAPRVFLSAAGIGAVMGLTSVPLLLPLVPDETRRSALVLSNVVSCGFLVLGWFLIYFCYHYFQKSREAVAKEWQLRAAMRDNELRTLRAQLNPHFLFNSLNSLRGLIPESPDRAQEAVTQLAALLRHTLRLSRFPTVRLEEELGAARNYLALEKIRFDERLRYELEVDPDVLDQAVPPMILQNLVENALKHGIAHRREGGDVRVVVRGDGERVRIRVENPGRGPLNEPGIGLGLKNAREQLDLLFEGEASLELSSDHADRVVCEVVLPRREQRSPRDRDGLRGLPVPEAGVAR